MTGIDYFIMAAYLVGLVALGLFCARGQRTTDDFFLAGRKMGWLVLGVVVTIVVGYLLSCLWPPLPTEKLRGLTYWTPVEQSCTIPGNT